MNSRQMNALQRALDRRTADDPSRELDKRILREARIAAEQRQQQANRRRRFAPIGFAGNALASVSVTAVVFFIMARMIALPQNETVLTESVAQNSTTEHHLVSQNRQRSAVILHPQIESYTPDQVLLELSLPSVPDLIRSMHFVADDERTAATVALISALADINSLIGIGQLDEARRRYEQLRQRCYACELPGSLEALALAGLASPGRG